MHDRLTGVRPSRFRANHNSLVGSSGSVQGYADVPVYYGFPRQFRHPEEKFLPGVVRVIDDNAAFAVGLVFGTWGPWQARTEGEKSCCKRLYASVLVESEVPLYRCQTDRVSVLKRELVSRREGETLYRLPALCPQNVQFVCGIPTAGHETGYE